MGMRMLWWQLEYLVAALSLDLWYRSSLLEIVSLQLCMHEEQYAEWEWNMANEKSKQNSIATRRDGNYLMDVWSKIKGQIILCGIKAEFRNRWHSHCGTAAKQI